MGEGRLRTTNSRHSRVGGRHDGYGEFEGRKPIDLEELLELSEGDSLQHMLRQRVRRTPQTIEAGLRP